MSTNPDMELDLTWTFGDRLRGMITVGGWAMNHGDRTWHFYTGFGATACGRPDNQRPTLGRVRAPDCARCVGITWPASEMRTPRPR